MSDYDYYDAVERQRQYEEQEQMISDEDYEAIDAQDAEIELSEMRQREEEEDHTIRLKNFYEKNEDEYLEDEKAKPENRPTKVSDLDAFLMIHRLFPTDNGKDIIAWAEHDKIGLRGTPSELDDETLLELLRLGVLYDEKNDCFYMHA
jgi:hypothetical protein